MNEYTIVIGDREQHVALTRHGAAFETTSAGSVRRIEISSLRANEAILTLDGVRHVVPFVRVGDELHFDFGGEIVIAEVTAGARRAKSRQREHTMAAPMPALVTKILVEPGQRVARGAPLVILEAMKMEHQISAPYDGTVEEIRCKAGEMVQPPDDLIVLARTPEAP
ncbi:MAG: acetyl-CoA carboxylase biotin carboxyl carrier protein subunit [Thermoanaerobaculia bacterium]